MRESTVAGGFVLSNSSISFSTVWGRWTGNEVFFIFHQPEQELCRAPDRTIWDLNSRTPERLLRADGAVVYLVKTSSDPHQQEKSCQRNHPPGSINRRQGRKVEPLFRLDLNVPEDLVGLDVSLVRPIVPSQELEVDDNLAIADRDVPEP